MASFGSTTPARLGGAAMVPTFPTVGTTYTSPDGAVVVPAGALDKWFAYRQTLGAVRGDVVGIGDSTMFGSGGNYSFLQRLRDKATGATTGGPSGFGMIDGGKGMFAGGESLGIAYDAPEIVGFVSSSFVGAPDFYDNTDGQYWYDNGAVANRQLVLQFRQSCARLWYSARGNAGDFTYSVDGGAAVTVKAYQATVGAVEVPISKYVYISGLAPNTTHTITITNLATSTTSGGPATGAACYVALAPMNATGVVFQKYATSGDTIVNRFYGGLTPTTPFTRSQYGMRYQTAFGLTPIPVGPTYTGAPVDTSQPAAGAINPVLALSNLGFNDLTGAVSGDEGFWTEYVKRFAGACSDAGCPGVVLSGQLPYNANWPTFGATRFNALKAQALASGLAWVDLFYPVGGPSLAYSGGTANPHLGKSQYQAQADYLWDNLLGLTT